MGKFLSFNYENASSFVASHELEYAKELVQVLHNRIHEQTGAGNDFLGWVDLPENYDKDEFALYSTSSRLKFNLIQMFY